MLKAWIEDGVFPNNWHLPALVPLDSLMNFRLISLASAVLGVSAFAADQTVAANHAADMEKGLALFNGEVAALLTEHCVKCHGGEKGTKGGFDLTTRETALKEGDTGLGIVPGKSAESLLVTSIRHTDPDLKMPKKADKLSDEAIAKIARWVDLGAPFARPLVAGKSTRDKSKVSDADRKFWSFQPLANPQPPAVKNEAWCRTPIDHFVLAKIEQKGIAPSGKAEKQKLIRRAYFDLIGLPPTPEQVEKFAKDEAPNAFEKVVDELLASPHYGERWGRHWLDLARYAESHGYEQDYDRPNAYHYRDYVIRALNADQPYDEFLRWQIAGDELAPENPEAWKATGFLAAGTHATQITANQAEKERYDELDDMAATIGNAFLGLSVGCARCHDHKFDPIPTADYYRFISTFTTTVRSDYDIILNPAQYRPAKEQWDREHAPLVAARTKFEKEQLAAHFTAWEQGGGQVTAPKWEVLKNGEATSEGGATLERQGDGSFLATGTNPDFDVYTISAPVPAGRLTAVKLEALKHEGLVRSGPGRAPNGNFALSDFSVQMTPAGGQPATLKLAKASATFEQKGLPVKAAIDGDKRSAWAVDPEFGKDHAAVFTLAEPVTLAEGATLTFTLRFANNARHAIGRTRLSVTDAPEPAIPDGQTNQTIAEAQRILKIAPDQRKPADVEKLLAWYRPQDAEWCALDAAVSAHANLEPKPERVTALVSSEGLKAIRLHTQGPDFYEKTFQLKRGDLNQKQNEAAPGFLQVVTRAEESRWITPPPADARTPMKRTALAKWLTDADAGAGNLAARVIVNRLWQHHLGRGIVSTPSDFGAQGEKPSHPELLDWLAGELIRGGWKLKPLHRQIMLSKVYQTSSYTVPEFQQADPDNALFAHFSRRRLEGETIRDSILAVSGVLDSKMFGPGTLDAAMKRRSIYFQIKRSQLPPMMITFDAPDTLQSMGQRGSTTVAPQSLLLLNNEQVRNAAKAWAKHLEAAGPTPRDKVYQAFREGLQRPPSPAEEQAVYNFLVNQMKSYEAQGKPEAAWVDVCQMIFGLNEFLYVD
jgi:mono/diheme cytochrome c family protein